MPTHEQELKYKKTWRDKNKKHRSNYNCKTRFGITFGQKQIMVLAQNNKCAICGKVFRDSRDTHIDHDHITKQVRGILCFRCNNGLGNFSDNSLILNNAISYLDRYSPKEGGK